MVVFGSLYSIVMADIFSFFLLCSSGVSFCVCCCCSVCCLYCFVSFLLLFVRDYHPPKMSTASEHTIRLGTQNQEKEFSAAPNAFFMCRCIRFLPSLLLLHRCCFCASSFLSKLPTCRRLHITPSCGALFLIAVSFFSCVLRRVWLVGCLGLSTLLLLLFFAGLIVIIR
jgi:hypothetical protein